MASITDAFSKFALLKQLGMFSWNPGNDSNSKLKPFCKVTAQDVLTRIPSSPGAVSGQGSTDDLADGLQRMALECGVPQIRRTPLQLPVNMIQNLRPQRYPNRFPNDHGYIVPLYVALQRGVSLQDIDFLLGGSALDVLASGSLTSDSACKYLVQRALGVIVVAKSM